MHRAPARGHWDGIRRPQPLKCTALATSFGELENPPMNAEEQKAARERAIFEAFLACEGAPKTESGSVESRRPPEPDILCNLADGGGSVSFELVEIVESEWAQLISNQIRLQQALYTEHDKAGKPLAAEYGTALIYVRCLAAA